jgi:hypothetical protein
VDLTRAGGIGSLARVRGFPRSAVVKIKAG